MISGEEKAVDENEKIALLSHRSDKSSATCSVNTAHNEVRSPLNRLSALSRLTWSLDLLEHPSKIKFVLEINVILNYSLIAKMRKIEIFIK